MLRLLGELHQYGVTVDGSEVVGGQRLLLEVYNALSRSRRWKRAVLIVTYDEHGGFFDHVSPPSIRTFPPGDQYLFFRSTGLRVPAIVISPLVSVGSVYKENLDHTSILKFIGEKFGMGGGYSPEVDKRQVGSVAQVLDRSTPRSGGAPEAPEQSVIIERRPRVPSPLRLRTPNVQAFERIHKEMCNECPHELATKFPHHRDFLKV